MSGKSLELSGCDDIPLYEGKISELILDRIKNQDGENVVMVDYLSKKRLTSRDFLVKIIQLAEALKKIGIQGGDVISIVSENSLNYFVPVLASFLIGATINPLNPIYSIGELKHAFKLTRPKIIFCSDTALENVTRLKQEFEFIEKVIELKGGTTDVLDMNTFIEDEGFDVCSFETNKSSEENVAIILSSSGTTGLPKGVIITYDSLRYHMLYIESKEYLNINSEEITLAVVPFFHVFGLLLHLFAIFVGMKSVLISKFNPQVFLKAAEEHKITKLFIVPQLAQFLAKSPMVDHFDLSSIADIFCGSAPLGQQLAKDLNVRFNLKLRQLYGLTETGAVTIDNAKCDEKLGTVGVLIPKLKGKVRDPETGKTLGPNEEGELCFKGLSIMKGYINDDKATTSAFDEEGYLRTGDLGYYDQDGYFFVVDRLKDLIKYKGFQVPPVELEMILLQHPSVAEVAVIGIPDERAGELALAVVVKVADKNVTEQELINLVAGQVSVLKHLHGGVKFADKLPKTCTGKVMKRILRGIYINM